MDTHDQRTPGTPSAELGRRQLLGGAGAVGLAGLGGLPLPAMAGTEDALAPLHEIVPTRIYGDDRHKVAYRRPIPNDAVVARYPGFKPGSTVLRKGTIHRPGALKLPCDIVFERDVPVRLRDGVTIYTDVYRPAGPGKFPAVVAWSPYGKELGGQLLEDVPFHAGVDLSGLSGLQKFEGPDPALFVANGYAVLNPDCRGAYMSEGNFNFWGRQLAEDGYDFIEWAAMLPWCSGKVALAGNSWLAISQWFIAAENPPHLAAIAPWEGFSDHFREAGNRGGIPDIVFSEVLLKTFAGRNLLEDQTRMVVDQQLLTPYWQDKAARLERIDVPAYVVASYTHPAHTHGTFAGFRRMSSRRKWLRIHNTNEWKDFYDPAHQADLLKFLDHVVLGKENGWDATPAVRMVVLNPGGDDIVGRPESSFPLARQQFVKLFLAAGGKLVGALPAEPSIIRYDTDRPKGVDFDFAMTQATEVSGYMSLRLWVEADGADDMELRVTVRKLDSDGDPFPPPRFAPMGAGAQVVGLLRVSQRATDPARSTPSEPFLTHDREQLLAPGEIVAVDIPLWPMAMLYAQGEIMRLTVTAARPMPSPPSGMFGGARVKIPRDGGTYVPGDPPPMLVLGGSPDSLPAYVQAQSVPVPPSRNHGTHIIHAGGRFDSHLLIPTL